MEDNLTPKKSNKKLLPILGAVMALFLVVGVAVASYFVSNKLANTAGIAANAPASVPQAAAGCNDHPEKCNKKKENCVNNVCVPKPKDTEAPGCNATNCPGPEFYCATNGACLNTTGYCGGTKCNGTCDRSKPDKPKCITSTITSDPVAQCTSPNTCKVSTAACGASGGTPVTGVCNSGYCCAPAPVNNCVAPYACYTGSCASNGGLESVSNKTCADGKSCCVPAVTQALTCTSPNSCMSLASCNAGNRDNLGKRGCGTGGDGIICCAPAANPTATDTPTGTPTPKKCSAPNSCKNSYIECYGSGGSPISDTCTSGYCCSPSAPTVTAPPAGGCQTNSDCKQPGQVCEADGVCRIPQGIDVIHCGNDECNQTTEKCCPSGCKPKSSSCGGGSCTDTDWTPDPKTVCNTRDVTQTSNCGNTRVVKGTKDCVVGACVALKIYKKGVDGVYSLAPMTSTELAALKLNNTVLLATTANEGSLKARFQITIDNVVEAPGWRLSTGYQNAAKTVSTYEYTITKAGQYKFEGQVSTKP